MSAPANALLQRITIDQDICHGKPVVRGMRYPVTFLLDLLSSGMSFDDIIEDYPALEAADLYACLAYASVLTDVKSVHKVPQ